MFAAGRHLVWKTQAVDSRRREDNRFCQRVGARKIYASDRLTRRRVASVRLATITTTVAATKSRIMTAIIGNDEV